MQRGKRRVRIRLSRTRRLRLEAVVRRRSPQHWLVIRARIVLLSYRGSSVVAVGVALALGPQVVRRWLRRFAAGGFDALKDRPRSGRPKRIEATVWQKTATLIVQSPARFGLPDRGVGRRDGTAARSPNLQNGFGPFANKASLQGARRWGGCLSDARCRVRLRRRPAAEHRAANGTAGQIARTAARLRIVLPSRAGVPQRRRSRRRGAPAPAAQRGRGPHRAPIRWGQPSTPRGSHSARRNRGLGSADELRARGTSAARRPRSPCRASCPGRFRAPAPALRR